MPKHQYRFRGSIQPSAEVKRPVRAELPAARTPGVGLLYLDDVIDSWGGDWGISAREFNAALAELGDVSEIRLHINSPGGEVYEGIAILNSLRRHPARTVGVVDGLAASAASFIAAGLDELEMGKNAELMAHDAWGIIIGPPATVREGLARLEDISNNISTIYQAKAGGTAESWRQLMIAETWFSAEEAVAAGLADRIEGEEPVDASVKNAFDLSVFKHAGRDEAPAPAPVPTLNTADEPVNDRLARFQARRAAGDRLARLDRRAA